MNDSVGRLGEVLFELLITRYYDRRYSLFRPQFLGDKFPTVDYLVELHKYPGRFVPYFFVQVKTTSRGYTKKDHRLKIRVPSQDMRKLSSYPAPVYLVGVNSIDECAYLACVPHTCRKAVTSLSTQFPIDRSAQDILWHEVKDFWESCGTLQTLSAFIDPNWS